MIFCKFLPHKEHFSWKVPSKFIYNLYLKHQKYPFCAPIFHPLSETESYVEIPKVAMVNEGNLCVSINKSFTESIKCKEPVSLVCTLSL